MTRKSLLALSLVGGLGFIGCASGPDPAVRLTELTSENSDLKRQNADKDGRIAACKDRCDALERELAKRAKPSRGRDTLSDSLRRTGLNVERYGNKTVIEIPSDIFFRSGSSNLSADGARTLMTVAGLLKREYPKGKIRIEGHTDSDPIRKTKKKYHCNLDLGFQRAHQVAHVLVDRGGIEAKRVVCETYGPFEPKDPAHKSKNRRVQIVIAR